MADLKRWRNRSGRGRRRRMRGRRRKLGGGRRRDIEKGKEKGNK